MKFFDHSQRLDRFYTLIQRRATGSVADLCQRLDVCEQTLRNDLKVMEQWGAEIRFSRSANSYIQTGGPQLNFNPVVKNTDQIRGGTKFFPNPILFGGKVRAAPNPRQRVGGWRRSNGG